MADNPDSGTLRRFLAAGTLAGKTAGTVLTLDAQEAHHAARVLRLTSGTAIELFDGLGYSATAILRIVGRGRCEAILERLSGPVPRPTPTLTLAFAVPKGDRLNWLIEKATELGADELLPVRFARTVAGGDGFTPAKIARWQGHIVAAAKQCGRDYLPRLADFVSPDALPARARNALGLMGCPDLDLPGIGAVLGGAGCEQTILIVVGPEGGLTAEEKSMLTDAGFRAVRLGRNVLRIETAAIALLAAVVAATGR